MKIRAKLTILAFGIVALVLAALTAVYVALLRSVDRINAEKSYLVVLSDAMKEQLIDLSGLPYSPMQSAVEGLGKRRVAVDEAFVSIGKIKSLRSLNKELAEAFEVIDNLRELNESRLAKVDKDIEALEGDCRELFYIVDSSISFFSFYSYGFDREKLPLLPVARSHVDALVRDIGGTKSTLSTSISTIAEQSRVIDEEVAKIRARAIAFAAVIVAAVLALAAIMAMSMARGIAKSVIRIERGIAALKEGDLSGRTEVSSGDEIGLLSRNLDLFLDALSTSLSSIKGISKANIQARDQLMAATDEAVRSTASIEEGTTLIAKGISEFEQGLAESLGSIGKIAEGIVDLDAMISGQSSMVEEATASVTEMLASLESMGQISGRNRSSSEDLVRVSDRGRDAFQEASDKVGEISRNVDIIRGMADVIADVASRTNLLAMNAAIEAAHAGDTGRGFAVVAEEIRKLSEASSSSSKDISGSIDAIVSMIEGAAAANADMKLSFSTIDTGIREVSLSVSEMNARITEVKAGCSQILQAMVELQDRSAKVKASSLSMEEGSEEMKATMRTLSHLSADVTSIIASISSGIEKIGSSMRSVAELSERVGEGSGNLDIAVSRFKLKS